MRSFARFAFAVTVGAAVGWAARDARHDAPADPIAIDLTRLDPPDGTVVTVRLEPLFVYDDAKPGEKRTVARPEPGGARWKVGLVYPRGSRVVYAASR